MKSRSVIIAVGAIFAALIVLAISLSGSDDTSPDRFSAFDGDVGAAEKPDMDGLAVPTATDRRARADSEPAPDETTRPPRDPLAAVRGSEDTLNRMGPVGEGSTEASPGGPDDDPSLPRGIVDKEDVQAGIAEVTPLVKKCYEEALVDFPDAAGKVTVGFRIIAEDGEGRVEMSELNEENTDLFDVKLHDCMLQSIGEARFDAPQSGGVVNVTYPFQFQSDPADEDEAE